jgi:neutral ceramidase
MLKAILIDNGLTRAALVSVDAGMLGEQVWRAVSQRVEKELGIPVQNLIMNPTHRTAPPEDPWTKYSTS